MKIANDLLIFYIPVGSLPPLKVEALMDRMKDKLNLGEWDLPDDISSLWVPVRTINRIEVDFINFRKFSKGTVKKINNLKKVYDNQKNRE